MQKFNWNLEPSSGWVLWWCPHGKLMQWSTKIPTYSTWPLVTMQACFCHSIKKSKNSNCDLLSHNSDLYWNCEFTSCNSDFIRIVRYCKNSQLQEKSQNSEIKFTITHCPLYSMAEISFHRFHMCKGKNIMQSTISSPLFSIFLIQLLLSLLQLFLSLSQASFCSLSDSLCCSASTEPIQRGIFYSMLLM